MPTAFNQFRVVQAGIEGTKGTAVPATKKLRGDLVPTERHTRYYSQFPQGFRANPGGTGVEVGAGWSAVFNSELTFEEILWFLQTGLRGSVAGAAGAGDEVEWTFSPQLTSEPTLQSMTLDYTESDGSTNHVAREVPYVMTKGYRVDWAINQEARFSADLFGRVSASAAPTAALSYYAEREIAKANMLSVYMDSAWDDLGDTLLSGNVRSASLAVMFGNEEDMNLEGRSALDMTGHRYGLVAATLSLGLQLNAAGAAALGNWRAGDARFVRLEQLGSEIALPGGVFKTIRHDLAVRFTGDEPQRQVDGQYRNVTIAMETFLDPTSSKTLEVYVQNTLATL